jgi:hypothetical protein
VSHSAFVTCGSPFATAKSGVQELPVQSLKKAFVLPKKKLGRAPSTKFSGPTNLLGSSKSRRRPAG